ncbi:methyltransferase domain-containing protein [Leptospira sp. FAT2]|uniref:class I SAM-dependent methyltransferase n=1 Tax=Leptospira sanjuanensis TaxID=2879643 RepID=UPI001EE8F51A|nr:class I SAM-dependent methyltransferase [Leptospira sanjuanensis]MCG6192353.1 methyltransferase domain-containing protein [Leptospira sanjuanensis]
MKVRDSGMPEAAYWDTLFNVPLILDRMKVVETEGEIVEFGSGYGTFTLFLAGKTHNRIFAFEIEGELVLDLHEKASLFDFANILPVERDIIASGTGLEENSVGYVMIFNLLHHDDPVSILKEAYRILKPGGNAGLVHWNYDSSTPRGPKMEIRPKPESIYTWAKEAGFQIESTNPIDLPPYHYGFLAQK